jgi:ABC-2 type transport system ATP-binding protein
VRSLDELTTGPRPAGAPGDLGPRSGIRETRKTVFLTTHLMEEAERLCDRVAIIDHGRIVDMGRRALVVRHCAERTVILASDDPRRNARSPRSRGRGRWRARTAASR